MPLQDPTPGALVARFSWELEAAHQDQNDESEEFSRVQAGIREEVERKNKEGRREIERIVAQFSPEKNYDEIALRETENELRQMMKSFQALFPGQAAQDVRPTSWEDVQHAVSNVQKQWETRQKDSTTGRIRDGFRRMCNTFNNHSTALKMLPSETEWVSVIAGSVSIIIKAAANYTKITEAFTSGIVVINDAVGLVRQGHVYETDEIRQLTMRLYSHVFKYLSHFIRWFSDWHGSRRRFALSFNENLALEFRDDLDRVVETSRVLSQHVQRYAAVDVRINRIIGEETNENLRYLTSVFEAEQRDSRLRAQVIADMVEQRVQVRLQSTTDNVRATVKSDMEEYFNRMLSGIVGQSMTNLLAQSVVPRQIELRAALQSDEAGPLVEAKSVNQHEPTTSTATEMVLRRVTEIDSQTRQLERYFERSDVAPIPDPAQAVVADAAFVARLNSFTTDDESQVLYVHARYRPEGHRRLRESVAAYASLARRAGVHVVSHFCDLPLDEPPEHRTREAIGLTGLLYSLIRQVVGFLPVGLDSGDDVPLPGDVLILDGTLRTWDNALSLFSRLAGSLNLPLLLFVVDGLNLFEDDSEHSTDEELEGLVNLLMDLVERGDAQGRVVKVLFSTTGPCDALSRKVDDSDQLLCNMGTSRRPDHLRGRHRVSYPGESDSES
ncbi:phytanoyl- dioxygenase family protein [Colletotrichum plurivorum]|uniref:Phytanoyl- dioxygenase family protein n=1 Tax=Colletotrichum plurivorum TaxID=2175906 RepID=A0A8H6JTT7_9PEZI|nr:phytanoyl- dioxygenase family protein [Colletotrichum plurivorum]